MAPQNGYDSKRSFSEQLLHKLEHRVNDRNESLQDMISKAKGDNHTTDDEVEPTVDDTQLSNNQQVVMPTQSTDKFSVTNLTNSSMAIGGTRNKAKL